MNCVDKRFSKTEIEILVSLKGKKLQSFDYVEVETDHTSYEIVRLHFDNKHIDLTDSLETIALPDLGFCDEAGVLNISKCDSKMLEIPEVISSATKSVNVNKVVKAFIIVNEVITICSGKEQGCIKCPQALVLDLGDEFLVLDREVWFSDSITFNFANRFEDVLYDNADSWCNEPGSNVFFEYSRDIVAV